jgi:hypothetical protein
MAIVCLTLPIVCLTIAIVSPTIPIVSVTIGIVSVTFVTAPNPADLQSSRFSQYLQAFGVV